MVDLVPVDHDPFAVSLIPVDHDPFAVDPATAAAFPETVGNPGIDAAVRGIAGGIKDFVTTPGTLANTANPYPPGSEEGIEFERTRQQAGDDWARNAALATMGTGAVAGLPVNAGEAVLGAGPIRAYHGSPHDFDAFSLDKIGTGEGAQAYGHGLYFAENPKVAEEYRNTLADWKVDGRAPDPSDPAHIAAVTLKAHGGNANDAMFDLMNTIRNGPQAERATAVDAYNMLKIGDKLPEATGGRMYEVQINADPEHFLDWDKPLSEQPKAVQALQPVLGDTVTSPSFGSKSGGDALWYAHNMLKGAGIKPESVLKDAGIPGIKYLDQGSRATGEGSRNYVVFDDKLIDIIRKYALAGVALPPAIQAAYDQMQQAQPTSQPDYLAGLRK